MGLHATGVLLLPPMRFTLPPELVHIVPCGVQNSSYDFQSFPYLENTLRPSKYLFKVKIKTLEKDEKYDQSQL